MSNFSTTKNENHAEQQAQAQYESIVSMLAAVNCDYARMDELKEEREELACSVNDATNSLTAQIAASLDTEETASELSGANDALANWDAENSEELQTLKSEAGECENEEEAREHIQEDPLEIQVRSSWENAGEDLKASEFMILLCTGGPAVRIVGELSEHGEPERAWLEYQDWGTPWTRFYGAESDTLVEYASNFYFGG
jgi:gas vesicle protein